MNSNNKKSLLVWDLPVRLFHWLLVLALAGLWFTGEQGDDWLTWHFYLGYFVLGLIIFRVLWGVFGTRYALFKHFIVSPIKAISSLKQQQDTPGHTPLGGYMALLLMMAVLLQAVSGLFTSDEIFTDGPWRSVVGAEYQDLADWAHHNLFTLIQIAAAIHIAAAFYYLLFKKNNLIMAMINGKKMIDEEQRIASSKLWLALVMLLIAAAIIYILITLAPEASLDDYY